MRHRKHNHLLGVKTAHRTSLLANLSCSLIENGRIKTTLAKAKALRPAVEKAITLAKNLMPLRTVQKKSILEGRQLLVCAVKLQSKNFSMNW